MLTALLLFALAVVANCMWQGRREDVRKGFCEMTFALVILTLAQWGQCPGGRCGGPPQMFPMFQPPMYLQPQPVFQQPQPVAPSVPFVAQPITEYYPTYHYPAGTTMVWRNGELVPSQEPTQVSYPGQPHQPFVQGKQYPPIPASEVNLPSLELEPNKPLTLKIKPKPLDQVKDGKNGAGCPNVDCDCGKDCSDPANPLNSLGQKSPLCSCKECRCKKCLCNTVDEKPKATGFTQAADDTIPNYGIDKRHMQERSGRKRYSTNDGKEISKKEVDKLLGADGLPDDSTQMFMTTVADDATQQAVREIVKSNPAVFANVRCKFYAPTDDMVKDKGFAGAITLSDSKGKVEYRFPTMPEKDVLVGEVNKRRPDYDPNKDPSPNKPGPLSPDGGGDLEKLFAFVKQHTLISIVLAFAGYVMLVKPNLPHPAPAPAK